MGEITGISWTDHTFNPWIGCMKVGPACDGCYAEALMGEGGRYARVEWGAPGKGVGTRARTAPGNWKKPLTWDRKAREAGERRFVFCASLADVFDNAVPAEWRRDLFDLIRATPNLIWLLLTKRPGNIVRLFRGAPLAGDRQIKGAVDFQWPRNAAIGCTVVTQEEADRDVPLLLKAKAALNPAFAFLSMEPLLGPVDLTRLATLQFRGAEYCDALTGQTWGMFGEPAARVGGVDWVIAGGETDQGKHKARPASPLWYRDIRDQCAAVGVPFHFKQWGEWEPAMIRPSGAPGRFAFGDYETERGRMIEVDGYPRQFTMVGARARLERVGKTRAGRLLDGELHDARP